MKKKLIQQAGLLTALLLFTLPVTMNAAPLTLEETVRLVKENNPMLKAAVEEINVADARVRQSQSAYYPQISASAGYTWIDPVPEVRLGPMLAMKMAPSDNYEAKITAKATLFDFGKRSDGVAIARAGKNAAVHTLDIARRDLSYQTVQLFYGIIFLRESVRVQEKEIAALQKAMNNTSKRYNAGTATRFDVLSTDVRIQAARSKKLSLEHQLRRQEITLRRLTGLAANDPLDLKGSFAVHPEHANGQMLVADALQRRPELKLAEENEISAKHRRSIAIKNGLPVVSGLASWGYSTGIQPNIDDMREKTVAGIQVELPLFTGFRTSAERQEAAAQLRAAAERRLDTEQQVKSDVEETLHALESSRENILTTESQVQQAKLAAEHARARYDNGMATTLDLLDTEAALGMAELARLQAAYDYVMSSYTLKRATGEIFW